MLVLELMSNTKKLDNLNQKIAELVEKRKNLESKMIDSMAKHIASLLIKKRASDINIKEFIKRIEPIIDEMKNEDLYEN